MPSERAKPPEIDPKVASSARVYDYWLGGKDNFAADRELAAKIDATMPGTAQSARVNRAFLRRTVRYAVEAGVTQFLDIGSGLPTAENTHEVAQRVSPDARVVYVDYDPIVLAHGRAILAGSEATTFVQADLHEPDRILRHPDVNDLLDLTEPFAVLLLGVLHFVGDDEDPYGLVARLRDAMPPGSYLIFSHLTGDFDPRRMEAALEIVRNSPVSTMSYARTRDEVARFFEGFEIVDPGIVSVDAWRPEDPTPAGHVWLWAGVGRKGG